jgi:hypothetical protein
MSTHAWPGAPLDPALGWIASSRSIVPEAQRVCRSSHQNTSLSLAHLCGARGRTPSRPRASQKACALMSTPMRGSRAGAVGASLEGSRPRDPSFPKPSVFVDRAIRIRLHAWLVVAAREDARPPGDGSAKRLPLCRRPCVAAARVPSAPAWRDRVLAIHRSRSAACLSIEPSGYVSRLGSS